MVDKGGEGVGDGDLLSTTLGACGDKHTAHLASKCGLAPEGAGGVPECLTDPIIHMRAKMVLRGNLPSTARGSYHSEWEHRRGTRQS